MQAQGIGIRSGVVFTQQEQAELYKKLRGQRLESDQVIYAEVLEQTGGPVEVFRAEYPHIFKPK